MLPHKLKSMHVEDNTLNLFPIIRINNIYPSVKKNMVMYLVQLYHIIGACVARLFLITRLSQSRKLLQMYIDFDPISTLAVQEIPTQLKNYTATSNTLILIQPIGYIINDKG